MPFLYSRSSKDLHYVAVDKGEMVLADAARRKAREAEFPAIAAATGKDVSVWTLFFFHYIISLLSS